MENIKNWKDVQEIYGSVNLEFCIGVIIFLEGKECPDNSEDNMRRQGYWRAKSDKLNLKYTAIHER